MDGNLSQKRTEPLVSEQASMREIGKIRWSAGETFLKGGAGLRVGGKSMRIEAMMKSLVWKGLALGLMVAPALAQDAEELLERARIAATLQQTDLHGTIGKGWSKTDVSLFLRGEDIQFTTGKGAERFHMRLGDDQFDLLEIVNGETRVFPRAKLSKPIADSDLTYEDLSMRFLYWPNPSLEGDERVGGYDCWKIRVNNPGDKGDYSVVYVWVHKKFGAFMKIEGFDRTGKRLKRFEVDSVMKLKDGSYTLREMTVASMNGEDTRSRSKLRFDKPKRELGGPR